MEATLRFTDSFATITNQQGLGIPGWLYGDPDSF